MKRGIIGADQITRLARSINRNRKLSWVLADQIIVSGSNFLTGIIVARSLGIAEFGVFTLAWLIVLFVQSFQIALVISPMMSVGPKKIGPEAKSYYSAVLIQQFALSSAALVSLGLTWAAFSLLEIKGPIPEIAGALSICVFITQIQEFLRRYNFIHARHSAVFASDTLRHVSQAAALIFIPIFSNIVLDVSGVIHVVSICALIGALVFIPFRPAFHIDLAEGIDVTKRHFRMSKWLVGVALLQWTAGNLYIVVAGGVLGPAAVGALKASQNLIAVTHVFFQAADNVALPRAADIYHRQGAAGLSRFVKKLMVIGGAATALVCISIALPADFWLKLLFGSEYTGLGWVVSGFAFTYFLMAMEIPLRIGLLAMERARAIFVGYAIATVFAAVTSYLLVRNYGLYGAVGGIVSVQILRTIISASEYRILNQARPMLDSSRNKY